MRAHALLAFGLLALTLGGCVNREAQQQAKKTEELLADTTQPVVVEPVVLRTMDETIEITGEVATAEDVTVGTKLPGKIVSVYVKDGDPVTGGQVIASLDTSTLRRSVQQAEAQAASARSALAQARTNARIAPAKSAAAVASAQAALRAAKAQLQKARAGARPEERAQAESQVQAAKANRDLAKREMDRQRYLYEQGASSKQRLDQAEAAYASALAQYETALENLRMLENWTRVEDIRSAEEAVRQAEENVRSAQAQQRLDAIYDQQVQAAQANVQSAEAQVSIARQNLEDAIIRAPFAGRISGRPVQSGTVLGAGGDVARIVGAGGSYFEGQVPSSQIAQVKVGDSVEVRIDALGDRVFTGSVAAISPAASNVGRLFRVRVQLNDFGSSVKPGMFARGEVVINRLPDVPAVPTEAIIRQGEQSFVFVVNNGQAQRTEVTPGLRTNGLTQVSGVQAGSQVVVRGQAGLSDGAKVKIEAGDGPETETAAARGS